MGAGAPGYRALRKRVAELEKALALAQAEAECARRMSHAMGRRLHEALVRETERVRRKQPPR